MKGIVRAGGHCTRLYPATLASVSSYCRSTTSQWCITRWPAGCWRGSAIYWSLRRRRDYRAPRKFVRDDGQWGISIRYAEQARPDGLAQALVIGRNFIAEDHVAWSLAIISSSAMASREQLLRLARELGNSGYGSYLEWLVDDPG